MSKFALDRKQRKQAGELWELLCDNGDEIEPFIYELLWHRTEVERLKAENRRLETSLSEWKALHAKQVSYHLDWEGETAKLLRNSTIKVDQYKARVAELEAACMYVEGGPDAAQEKEGGE